MATTVERIYSADDLWELSHDPAYDEQRLELSKGVLIQMSPAGGEHGELAAELLVRIRPFVKEHRLGRTTAAETGYILHTSPDGKDTVRAPDVGFISAARWSGKLPRKYVPIAPDLAVEVVSPTDKPDEIADKVRDYLQYGVRLMWFFYPQTRTVRVYPPAEGIELGEDDVLDGGDVLPGFRLRIGDVFDL
jgi:Uma2 family endonuclease